MSLRTIQLNKLRNVADAAPKDVTLTSDGEEAVHGNRMLLSLCSDYFEALFRSSTESSHRLREVDASDVRTVVAYSEGRYEPSVDDLSALMRIQDRFLMPPLLAQCEQMLRSNIGPDTWRDVARLAASYNLWDLVADVAVRSSRQTWARPEDPAIFGATLWEHGTAPASCVASVIRSADFLCVASKFAMASTWASHLGDAFDADRQPVFDALRVDLGPPECRMWPAEVAVVLDGAVLPLSVVADIARGVAASGMHSGDVKRRMPQHNGVLVSEQKRNMSKMDASIVAAHGSGIYQMVLMPATGSARDAFFSKEVPLMQSAEYHVYLNEEEALAEWWRRKSTACMLVTVRYRRVVDSMIQ